MNNKAVQNFLEITQASELTPCEIGDEQLSKCMSFSLSDLVALGVAFRTVSSAVCALVREGDGACALYEAVLPVSRDFASNHGAAVADMVKNNAAVTSSVIKSVRNSGLSSGLSGGSMFMALTILANNKVMKDISKTQKEILGFLQMDKQSQLKGDLIVLSGIIGDYQYNWDNDSYCQNREMQILDIKRNAEQNIFFYRSMIENRMSKPSGLHMDTNTVIDWMRNEFRYYRLSVYLYAFASFLDILLIGNFESSYLNAVVSTIDKYSDDYEAFYNKCLQSAQEYAQSAISSKALRTVAKAGRFLSKQLAKIPELQDLAKIDDKLSAGSDKVDEYNQKSIDKALTPFNTIDDCGIRTFADKIRLFDRMHNNPLKIAFDSERIYLMDEKAESDVG